MPKLKTAVVFLFVFLFINLSFIAMNYVGDSVPQEFVKHRIQKGFKRHNITTDPYPLFRFGLPSIYSLIGIDQISDCMTYLHALYEPTNRLKNAITPGYLDVKNKGHTNACQSVKQIAFNEISGEGLSVNHKVRLWHGSKTALLWALPKLNIFQINMLIKQTTYLAYFVLALLIFMRDKRTGIAFAPVALLGIFASGVTVYGGLSNSIPYLVAIMIAIVLAAIPYQALSHRHRLTGMAGGCVLAFFYELDGSLILASALILFCAYFHVYSGLSLNRRWRQTFGLMVLFAAGFIGVLLLKQFLGFAYFDPAEVWNTFTGAMQYRISGESDGKAVEPLAALTTQFDRYYFAVINWHGAANFLKFSGTWGWLVAAILAIIAAQREGKKPLFDYLLFLLIGLIVVARYLIMANHSQIHTIIVSRYLFVLFAFAWAAMCWFGWGLFNKNRSGKQ